jgi:hypothetical protein
MVKALKDMYRRMEDRDALLIVTDPVGKAGTEGFRESLVEGDEGIWNFSIRIPESPDAHQSKIISLASLFDDWLADVSRGELSTIKSVQPVDVYSIEAIREKMEKAWDLLRSA